MRVAILWDWDTPYAQMLGQEDGVIQTFRTIASRVETRLFTRVAETNLQGLDFVHKDLHYQLVELGDIIIDYLEAFKPDYIFCWGSLDRPWHSLVGERLPEIPKGLRFSGGPHDNPNARYFNTIFCESEKDAEDFEAQGIHNTQSATAANVDLFKPLPRKKIFRGIYPTSFCAHKNVEIFADAFGGSGLICGYPNEAKLVEYCRQRGTLAWPRVPSNVLVELYNHSYAAVATGGLWGGGQRMILEAMSCNVPPIVINANPRGIDYIKASGYGAITDGSANHIAAKVDEWVHNPPEPIGRDYVLSKFTPDHFADAILSDAESSISSVAEPKLERA